MAMNYDLLDAEVSRPLDGGPSFSFKHRAVRATWRLVWFIFASWTPRQAQPWRRTLLKAFGAELALTSDVRGSSRVWYPPNLVMEEYATIANDVEVYNMAKLFIGARALVSQRVTLCSGTHDYNSPFFQLITKPIKIGADSWIAAEAFVGPGVTVGEGAVLGARAVAMRDIEPWTVCSGNPAQVVRKRHKRQ